MGQISAEFCPYCVTGGAKKRRSSSRPFTGREFFYYRSPGKRSVQIADLSALDAHTFDGLTHMSKKDDRSIANVCAIAGVLSTEQSTSIIK